MHEGIPGYTIRAGKVRAPAWLDKEFVLAMHGELIAEFGGTSGLLSESSLESTLGKLKQLHHYGDRITLYRLAAAYAYGLIKNHCFVDGNKRVVFVATYTFLGLNGSKLVASQAEAASFFLELAASSESQDVEIAKLARWLEDNSNSVEEA